jgi:stress response protein SCP2
MAKEVKLSARDQKLMNELQVGTKSQVVTNLHSGQSIELEASAVALYDFIRGCESMGLYNQLNQSLSIFRRKWSDAYMVLLD